MAISREEETLVEAATTAFRPVDSNGSVRMHPSWADLSVEGRAVVFEETVRLRELERALDGAGVSSTAKAVLTRIRRP